MTLGKRPITRRDFLAGGSGLAAAGLVGLTPSAAAEGQRSRVLLVRRQEVLDGNGSVNGEVLSDMLDEAVAGLMETGSADAAWGRLVTPRDVVGIKSNVWSRLRTPPELEETIRRRVIDVGVAPANVAVNDRGVRRDPVFQRATALINVRPMRTHHWSGLGTCLKNLIMFVPRPADYHGDACASLGAIWRLPEIEAKVRLNILVMLTPQFHGVGPHGFSREFVWPYRGIIVGTDPVAVDATGARIIQAQRDRHFGRPSPIRPSPHHIEIAGERYGLGVSDPGQIELVRRGWSEGALI